MAETSVHITRRWRPALPSILLVAALAIYAGFLAREAFWLAVGPQDNDWPLLMWLARAGTHGNLAALAVGHYGFLQLILVRLVGPMVGGTLIAAKLINIASVVVSAFAIDRVLRTLEAPALWRFTAVCFFLLSFPTFVTGWSEFGDPLALAFFACGLGVTLAKPCTRNLLIGGALIGVAGWVRLHFQTMGWGTALAFVGLALSRASPRREALERSAFFATSIVGAQLPVFLLNLRVHGALFSPIAHTFMGQVLFGANEFDMARSCAAAPFDGLFSSHGVMLASVMAGRILSAPLLPALALLLTTCSLLRRDSGQSTRTFAVLLALGYYVGFVAPSWGITPRLLFGFIFFVALCVGLLGPWLQGWGGRRVTTACALGILIVCSLNFRGERRAFRAMRNAARATWDRNEIITRAIRAQEVAMPTEVFAADWYVYPTDDPEMIGFYNWGFWNLLVPEFKTERPNPLEVASSPAAFETFLKQRGVRMLVLYDEPRVPVLGAIVRGEYQLLYYRLLDRIGEQYVYGAVE